jgi:hypothetical protein
VLGCIARGEASDVFLGRRDGRFTELVVIKALRTRAQQDLFAHEEEALEALEKSGAQGAPHFTRLVPQRVAFGTARLGMNGEAGEHMVAVHRYRSGFVHTWDDVAASYPQGIAPEACVWMWKRVLELLGFIHASGWVHGAVVSPHLLVHARDHGVVLVGFSRAARASAATPSTDVAMSARAVLRLIGASRATLAKPLGDLLDEQARTPSDAAWLVRDKLDAVARDVFGPPKYVPFQMPGWA